MSVTIHVGGLDDVVRALEKERIKCDSAAMQEIVMNGAVIIRDAWQARVPVATGRYRDSIRIEPTISGGGKYLVDILTDAVNPNDDYPYPLVLEYGSATVAPRPSFTPAVEETRDEVKATIKSGLERLFQCGIEDAYAEGNTQLGQALNRVLGVMRGGSAESGGAVR